VRGDYRGLFFGVLHVCGGCFCALLVFWGCEMIARCEPSFRGHAPLAYRQPVRSDRCNDPRLIERFLRVPAARVFDFSGVTREK
jgi:hypothetical protein